MSCTRCFGTQSCSCQITAGAGIVVEGSGTPAAPFVVSADAGAAASPSVFSVEGPVGGVYTITHDDGAGVVVVGTVNVNEVDMDVNSVTLAGSVITFGSEDGTTVIADICDMVTSNCGATAVESSPGVFVVTGNDGASVTIDTNGTPTTLASVTVVDNGDETSTITVTDSTGASVSDTYPTPDDVFVTGVTPATVANVDGSSTTTFTVALSDGSSTGFTYDHTPSATPTSIDIDPAAGTVTVTYTNPDGTTFDLADTAPAFADTDTTNATLTLVGDVLTITDSAGDSLNVTLPAGTVDTDTTNASLTHDALTGALVLTDSAGDTVSVNLPVDVPTTLSSVAVVDNGDETSTITVTDSTGASVSDTYPTPDDVFVTGVTPVTVVNADGSSTTTFTVALSDGSSIPFTYDHTPSAVPTSIDIDPAAGTVTVTYTNPDGTTFDLVDTAPAFADTDTTNATLTIAAGVLTITDSAGDSLNVTLPAGGSVSSVTGAAGAEYVHNDGDGTATTIAALDNGDGTADILGCTVSTEHTDVVCLTPSSGLVTIRTTDLKTGVETDVALTAATNAADATGSAFGVSAHDDTTPVGTTWVVTSGSFTLPCEQRVLVNSYYEIFNDQTSSTAGHAVYQGFVTFDGGTPLEVTGNTRVKLNAQDERIPTGSRFATLAAGAHTFEQTVEIQLNSLQPGDQHRITQSGTSVSWSELKCC